MARDTTRRRKRRTSGGLKQLPWRSITNPYDPIEVLDEEQVERIHEASLEVLETLGMKILSDQALDLLDSAGADVDRESRRVRFDRGLIAEYVAKTPTEFTLYARNPAHDVTFGGNRIVFTPVSSAPNCSDLDRGRRPGTYADFCNFLRLAHSLNIMHFIGGYPVEPQDLPVPTLHLDCYYGFITLTDLAWRRVCARIILAASIHSTSVPARTAASSEPLASAGSPGTRNRSRMRRIRLGLVS